MPVLKKWRIFERDDFSGEGARLRDELGKLIEELEETCVKFEEAKERKLDRDAKLAEKRRQGRFGRSGHIVASAPKLSTGLRIGSLTLRSPVVLTHGRVTNVAFGPCAESSNWPGRAPSAACTYARWSPRGHWWSATRSPCT